jgi:glycosyltransferase involved in cell wall biosynthesis
MRKMRLGFDAQAFQSVNAIGGIGGYNRSFLRRLFELYPDNNYELFYNSLYDKPQQTFIESTNARIHTIRYLKGADLNPLNKWIQVAAFRSSPLQILHILSPFEPQSHTVISNKMLSKTVVTVYDFIPFIFRELYLNSPSSMKLYSDRLRIVKSARLALSISEATRRDAIELFDISPDRIINIGIAPSNEFRRFDESYSKVLDDVKNKYGIEGLFVLSVSNLDPRKNLLSLLSAFVALPPYIRNEFSLVIVCNSSLEAVKNEPEIVKFIQDKNQRIKFLHFISNNDLVALYNCCHLFIYASLYEGGGLPVMEAMKCGAPVVASNTSSIPEYIGRTDNLFNPKDINAITNLMTRILNDDRFRKEIAVYGEEYSKKFSWDKIVKKAVMAYESIL